MGVHDEDSAHHLGVGALAPTLALLPAGPASASTEFDNYVETRDVTIVDGRGAEHVCRLRFELWHIHGGGPTPPEQQDSASGGTTSGTDGGDPACGNATVQVTVSYSRGGGDFSNSGTRSGPWPGRAFASVGVAVPSEEDPETGGPVWIDRLSSTHEVHFPACGCTFTETLVARK